MTLKLSPNPTFTCPVHLTVPGEAERATVTINYRHMGRSALRAYFEALGGKSDAAGLGEIIAGWSGIDEDYTPEALERLLDNYPLAASELFEAFRRELLEARAKN